MQINGSIAELRLALRALPCLTSDGWRYSVAKAPAQQQQQALYKVVVTLPAGRGQAHISVGALTEALAGASRDGRVSLQGCGVAMAGTDGANEVCWHRCEALIPLEICSRSCYCLLLGDRDGRQSGAAAAGGPAGRALTRALRVMGS
jgi:hypothetical protein